MYPSLSDQQFSLVSVWMKFHPASSDDFLPENYSAEMEIHEMDTSWFGAG
jgi:hypothetical protein